MFQSADAGRKDEFLDKAKLAREERAQAKQRHNAAVTIQKHVRRFIVRRRFCREIREFVNQALQIEAGVNVTNYNPSLISAKQIYDVMRRLFLIADLQKDQQRLLCLFVCVVQSQLTSSKQQQVYMYLAANKDFGKLVVQQLKKLLHMCLQLCSVVEDLRAVSNCCLSLMVTTTNCSNWTLFNMLENKERIQVLMTQMCAGLLRFLVQNGLMTALQGILLRGITSHRARLSRPGVLAVLSLGQRAFEQDIDGQIQCYLQHILTVPGLVQQAQECAEDHIIAMTAHRLCQKSLQLLVSSPDVFSELDGSSYLYLLANLVDLASFEKASLVEQPLLFMKAVHDLLRKSRLKTGNSSKTHRQWHPLLGWGTQAPVYPDALPVVCRQLQLLWSRSIIRLMFEPLFAYCENSNSKTSLNESKKSAKKLLRKALDRASGQASPSHLKLDHPVATSTCTACEMYLTAMEVLSQLHLDIVVGLCYQDVLLPHLWKLVLDLSFSQVLRAPDTKHPTFQLLQLACDTAAHMLTIVDDIELYEESQPLSLDVLSSIGTFLNQLIYKIIWSGQMSVEAANRSTLFKSFHSLLVIIYERDCRRPFNPADHWLIKDIKPSSFMVDLEKGKPVTRFLLSKVPHIIPHRERVMLFRSRVQVERQSLGLTGHSSSVFSPHYTVITVHRNRLLEDGYRQLAPLPPQALKGLVRVKFINQQGLDEAGIDQDGVFKEFLEETVKQVFDPSLNLFKCTSENKLYPSPTSFLQDNHLMLFEFVGRMVAKAIYEGIVIDVPFANFFLNEMLQNNHRPTYSSIDELPSLDQELYKNLTYVKHYEGDVSDLDLTFSCDEDMLGKLATYELVPGGKAIQVTNENKISYVHLMAHFKLRRQIRDQTNAFLQGFKSIINTDCLTMFSAPELQKLISGDTNDIDIEDLKLNTQYFGGFHGGHRVIRWLWDVVEKDFNAGERRQFLKFVTSCSKPPLLGFANLHPPFSIRCVEVADEQDTGDTLGSVLKGFFNLGRSHEPNQRLPTASTCFNLLKLPNYPKKSILRDKLRYAINSNTGFELS